MSLLLVFFVNNINIFNKLSELLYQPSKALTYL